MNENKTTQSAPQPAPQQPFKHVFSENLRENILLFVIDALQSRLENQSFFTLNDEDFKVTANEIAQYALSLGEY